VAEEAEVAGGVQVAKVFAIVHGAVLAASFMSPSKMTVLKVPPNSCPTGTIGIAQKASNVVCALSHSSASFGSAIVPRLG